jgi:hypothetical protein
MNNYMFMSIFLSSELTKLMVGGRKFNTYKTIIFCEV